jgi:HD superfamily phosphohydrolase
MGHVPFGHTLEDEMPVISKHDTPSNGSSSSRMDVEVSRVLTESKNVDRLSAVTQVLRAIDESKNDQNLYNLVDAGEISGEHIVLADIIGNTICADLFDYIKRDHLMTGIRATYDDRLLNYFGVGQHTVMRPVPEPKAGTPKFAQKSYKRVVIRLVRNGRVRNDALADLLDLLKLRYNLSDKVLFHPQKCAADAMLIKAVKNLKLTENDLLRYSDDGLLDVYREDPLIDMIRRRDTFRPVFICGWDGIHSYDEENTKQKLAEKLHSSHDLRSRIEKTIENTLGLPKSDDSVLLFCPRPKMTLKLVRALVQWRDGTIRRLNEIKEDEDLWTYKQIRLLEDIYPQLWRLYLFVRPSLRVRGYGIQQTFVEVLQKEAQLNATCDPAFQYYLEHGCADYKLGRLMDSELSTTPNYSSLPLEKKVAISATCHQELAGMVDDDRFGQTSGKTIALRSEDADLKIVRGVINKVMNERQSVDEQTGLIQ